MKSKLFTNAYDFVLALLSSNAEHPYFESFDPNNTNKYTKYANIELYTDNIEYFEGSLKLSFGGNKYTDS